jgi:hypothetical protein
MPTVARVLIAAPTLAVACLVFLSSQLPAHDEPAFSQKATKVPESDIKYDGAFTRQLAVTLSDDKTTAKPTAELTFGAKTLTAKPAATLGHTDAEHEKPAVYTPGVLLQKWENIMEKAHLWRRADGSLVHNLHSQGINQSWGQVEHLRQTLLAKGGGGASIESRKTKAEALADSDNQTIEIPTVSLLSSSKTETVLHNENCLLVVASASHASEIVYEHPCETVINPVDNGDPVDIGDTRTPIMSTVEHPGIGNDDEVLDTETVHTVVMEPTSTEIIHTNFEAPIDSVRDGGERLCDFLKAPASGSYTFSIASDDYGELWFGESTIVKNSVEKS